ncbi:C40 family peptidase, partial [Phocicoccus pinnipedialis]
KAEQERVAAQKAEADRQAAIKAEQERVAAQRAEEARIAAQKEQQRIAAQKAAEKRERELASQQASQPVSQGNGNAYTIALNLAKGKSYVYGANSAYAVDCSSFAQQFMAQYKGKNIPRTTWGQRDAGTRVSNPQPGDLVFFNNYSHVGVYVGNGMMVDALNPSEGVGLRAVSYVHGYVDGYYRY